MRKLALFLLLTLLGLTNCLEKFDFDRPDSIKGAVAIQGKLVKGNPSTAQVILRDVFDFFNAPRFITASRVYLLDEMGNKIELRARKQGFYRAEIPSDHPFFKVEFGGKYKIQIENLKGEDYESDFDELFPAPVPDKLVVKETQTEFINEVGTISVFDQLGFFIDTPLKPVNSTENSRLLWEIVGTAKVTDTPDAGRCFVSRDFAAKSCYANYTPVENYLIFDGSASSGDRIEDFLLNESSYTNLYAEGYYLTVYQQALSEPAFDFWSQVATTVNRTGSIFQEPAGNIPSNIKNTTNPEKNVYGYFHASEQHILRVYVSPELGRNPPMQCPLITMSGELAVFCCNCLQLEESTAEKPDWWVD
ncbi:MAG: DUF4249 family protein [Bacteroidota bacterium]